MKLSRLIPVASLALVLTWTGVLRAETKVEVKKVHLCCQSCVAAVGKILKTVDGVTGECDQKAKTITLTAKDDETAKKALQALADGGFHGETGNKDLTMADDSGAEKGKVKSLVVSGVHNCCPSCNTAIVATVKKVDGVTANTAKSKEMSFEVTGEFDATELVKELNAAGFHVKVKK